MQMILFGPADIRNLHMHFESSMEAEKIEYCFSSFYESSLNWEGKKKQNKNNNNKETKREKKKECNHNHKRGFAVSLSPGIPLFLPCPAFHFHRFRDLLQH